LFFPVNNEFNWSCEQFMKKYRKRLHQPAKKCSNHTYFLFSIVDGRSKRNVAKITTCIGSQRVIMTVFQETDHIKINKTETVFYPLIRENLML